ncbi:hypothetical protein [Streptomyces sp. DH10]|uniref:hypothetical protein n=1 Tax=Streptomyces sp. DH10 TaxID=3040121 RepID=UPI002442BC8C|nr:hypothetical protein [Streptomyces sp. DH10]MDG9713663.1 hypothetical protein [Streptomyces sp. DH10]
MRPAAITGPGGGDLATVNDPAPGPREVAATAMDLLAAGVIDPRVFISDRLPLAAFPGVTARFQAGIGRKTQPGLATV